MGAGCSTSKSLPTDGNDGTDGTEPAGKGGRSEGTDGKDSQGELYSLGPGLEGPATFLFEAGSSPWLTLGSEPAPDGNIQRGMSSVISNLKKKAISKAPPGRPNLDNAQERARPPRDKATFSKKGKMSIEARAMAKARPRKEKEIGYEERHFRTVRNMDIVSFNRNEGRSRGIVRDLNASDFAVSITRGPEIAILFPALGHERIGWGFRDTPLATRCATAHPSNLVTLTKSPPFGKAWDPVPWTTFRNGGSSTVDCSKQW